jgi:hypothetical protein
VPLIRIELIRYPRAQGEVRMSISSSTRPLPPQHTSEIGQQHERHSGAHDCHDGMLLIAAMQGRKLRTGG